MTTGADLLAEPNPYQFAAHLSDSPKSMLLHADVLDGLKSLESNSINLIVTSPPYADRRGYGGPKPDDYVDWFLPLSAELHRVLTDDGSFILNIKENVVNGERHTYVMELVIALRKQGWLWTEEYIWHKKGGVTPGKWPNRFRDAWEHVFHFTKDRKFAMYQDTVKVPVGDWAESRLKNLSTKDLERQASSTGSGFGRNVGNWAGRDKVFPSNVLHRASETGNKGHSAAFPEWFPEWFINLFTVEGDTVLDPFVGSGTTVAVAARMAREWVGIDHGEEFLRLVEKRLAQEHPMLWTATA